MEKFDFLLIILFIILAISLVVLMEKAGSTKLEQSRSEIFSRCLEKGYQDFKVTENKIYCVQKGEILILN